MVRAIDGDRGGARDSSRLITVCCVPPLRSAFLQLMTLRSTSSNPYHFNFFSVRFFSRGTRPLLQYIYDFLQLRLKKKKHIVLVVTAAIGEALVFFVFKKKKQNRTNNGWLQARSLHRERSAQRSAS